jgi:hypothetical protein
VPIAKDTVNNGVQVELGAKSVKHHSTINARGGKGSLVNLEGMGALQRLHRGVHNKIELKGHLVNLNGLESMGDEHIVRLRGGGTGHGNNRWQRAFHTKGRRGSAGYGTMAIVRQGTGQQR